MNHDGELDMFEQMMDIAMYDEMIKKSEVDKVGLDRNELECMDEDEQRVVLEEADLDLDDFDF